MRPVSVRRITHEPPAPPLLRPGEGPILADMPDILENATPMTLAAYVLGFFLALTVSGTAAGFLAERLWSRRRIFALPLAEGQYRFELLGNAVFLTVTVCSFTAALASGVVHFGDSSLARDGITFSSLLVGFQVFYWFLHRAMHTRKLLRFHRWHHRSHVTTPLTGQSMSFVEACSWMIGYVGLPIAFSRIAPIGFYGWAAYMAFNVLGNVFGHANIEPSLRISRSKLVSLFVNPFVYHSLHHARYRGHYAFQAALMDRLFGTEWSDWPKLFDRVREGRPLESLKERG